jgi:integrase
MLRQSYTYSNVARLCDGKVQLQLRNGIYQARIYKGKGTREYVWKSTETCEFEAACQKAMQFYAETQYKKANDIPLVSPKFSTVLNEYVAMRQAQYERGNYVRGKRKAAGQQTSVYNLRQIKRKAKFWHEYMGATQMHKITNALLRDYVDWRRDYYHRMLPEQRPQNCSLNPADKTLQDETVFALSVLKWAAERGYISESKKLDAYYKAERTTARPHFSQADYTKLIDTLQTRIGAAKPHQRYMREMLLDYVLVLHQSGVRVGELNSLRETDLTEFRDARGRRNYRLAVDGKTGKREVVLTAAAAPIIDRVLQRNAAMKAEWNAAAKTGKKQTNRKQAVHGNWLFRMADGNKITSLVDQFAAALNEAGIKQNAAGEHYTLYSLRHTYAVEKLCGKTSVYALSKNMGCAVAVIEGYYGKHATSVELATELGG